VKSHIDSERGSRSFSGNRDDGGFDRDRVGRMVVNACSQCYL